MCVCVYVQINKTLFLGFSFSWPSRLPSASRIAQREDVSATCGPTPAGADPRHDACLRRVRTALLRGGQGLCRRRHRGRLRAPCKPFAGRLLVIPSPPVSRGLQEAPSGHRRGLPGPTPGQFGAEVDGCVLEEDDRVLRGGQLHREIHRVSVPSGCSEGKHTHAQAQEILHVLCSIPNGRWKRQACAIPEARSWAPGVKPNLVFGKIFVIL